MTRYPRALGYVSGAITLTASVLTIWASRVGPLQVLTGLEVGAAGLALVAAVPAGVVASMVMPTVARWFLTFWGRRQRKFRELAPAIRELRHELKGEYLGDGDLDLALDVETRLRRLGISILAPRAEVGAGYAALIEMAERGAWKEARRRFPATPSTGSASAGGASAPPDVGEHSLDHAPVGGDGSVALSRRGVSNETVKALFDLAPSFPGCRCADLADHGGQGRQVAAQPVAVEVAGSVRG